MVGCKLCRDRSDKKLENSNQIDSIVKIFRELKKFGEDFVTKVDTKDGVKLMLGENTKILVRPSGTEPLLRIYFETNEQEKLENLKNLVKILTKN